MPLAGRGTRFRRRTGACALLALATATGLARAEPTPSPTRLRMLVLPHLGFGVFYLAQELGLFAAQGLDVEFLKLERSSGALPLLLRGDLDVMPLAPGPALFHAIAAGERVRIVAGNTLYTHEECASTGLVVRSGLELAPGARGLRISANRTLIGGYILERMLAAKGIDPEAQSYLEMTGSAEAAAFLEGQLDAAMLADPLRLRVEDSGAARMVLPITAVLPRLQSGVLAFGPRLLGDRELGQRFFDAYLSAVKAYREGHTPRNVDVLARALGMEHELVDRSCWHTISATGEIDFESLQEYQRWEVTKGNQDRVLSPAEYWDGTFVERAAKSLADRSR